MIELAGLVENAALRLLHHQRRHQILEHRARPGHQRAPEADLDDRPAEPEPVLGRQVALGDGEQAGQPRLGGQQVVAAFVELMLLDPIADRQQLAVLAASGRRNPFRRRKRARRSRKRLRRWREAPSMRIVVAVGIADMRLAGGFELGRPVGDVFAAAPTRPRDGWRSASLRISPRHHRQIDGADRRHLGLAP